MIPGIATMSRPAEIRARIYGPYPFNGSRPIPVVAEFAVVAVVAVVMGVAVVIMLSLYLMIPYDTLRYVALLYLSNSYRTHLTWIGDKNS